MFFLLHKTSDNLIIWQLNLITKKTPEKNNELIKKANSSKQGNNHATSDECKND